jgi:PHP family Zn ribbon phosphoesterase
MPWCEECAKYMAPSAMRPDGTCPTCGSDVETPTHRATEAADDDERAPWHFKLLVVMTVVYLAWRFFQIFT